VSRIYLIGSVGYARDRGSQANVRLWHYLIPENSTRSIFRSVHQPDVRNAPQPALWRGRVSIINFAGLPRTD
jgi:hypothetical protein